MVYALIGLTLSVTIGGLLYYLRADNRAKGKAEAEKEIVEATNEAITNIPLTTADLVARLRKRAANKREDQPLG